MTLGFTGRIARVSAARPWLTIGIWAVALAGAIALSGQLGSTLSQEDRFLTTIESDQAYDLSEAVRGDANAHEQETLVLTSTEYEFADASFQAALAQLVSTVAALDGVDSVVAPTPDAPAPVSASGHTALVTATLATDYPDGLGIALNEALAAFEAPGFAAYPYGIASAGAAFDELAAEGMLKGEIIGVAAALVILVIVFGALVASGLPLLVGGVSIVAAMGATAVVGQAFELSFFIVSMISMMGLALGIDYSLIIVQRFREELGHGRTVRDAVAVAGDTASRAVFFSGLAVLVSLAGMLVVPFTVMVSLGAGAIIVAIMAMLAALTLLPAVLRLLGHRVGAGRLPFTRRGGLARLWPGIARRVMKRPLVGALAGAGVLIAVAVPALSMRMVFPSVEALPQDIGYTQAVKTLSAEFGYGEAETLVAVSGAGSARSQVESLATAIEADPAFADVQLEWVGDAAFIDIKDAYDPSEERSENAVEQLRDTVIPQYLNDTDAQAYVGGEVASMLDFNIVMMDSAPWVALIVLGSSLVILLISFRSVVVALTAVALNALSTAAAYGVLVAVFQWGWLANFLGMPVTGGVTPWLPVFLFAVLFGLSMDYHVFLLSRVKERYQLTGDAKEAVAFGLTKTGSLITGAALIMVAVFVGFALGDLAEFSQMGLGLAVAIILDATVVRSLLVPSLMALLGDRNWYMPRWLSWVPTVHIESSGHQLLEPELVGAPRAS